jgi:hypothetical protein
MQTMRCHTIARGVCKHYLDLVHMEWPDAFMGRRSVLSGP